MTKTKKKTKLLINWKGFPEWQTNAVYSSIEEFTEESSYLTRAIESGELTITKVEDDNES